jgi:UDP-glucuronate decarboxylase
VQALRQQPLTVFGDGTQSRSFCYVDDMVDALVRLMDAPPDVTGPINLGNPEEFTMLELAEKVIELVGGGSIEHRPLPPDDPVQRRPDIAQAETLLGWKPTVDLDDGLARTVGYFRDLLDARSTTRCR